MRRLLYSFVFAAILVLAGYTVLASPDEPGAGGTVPTNTVWLPVVERGSSVPEECRPERFAATRGYAYWVFSIPFELLIEMLNTIQPVLATESDFREDSILAEGLDPNGPWQEANNFPGITVGISGFQVGRSYYSRLDYQCRGNNVHWQSFSVASVEPD